MRGQIDDGLKDDADLVLGKQLAKMLAAMNQPEGQLAPSGLRDRIVIVAVEDRRFKAEAEFLVSDMDDVSREQGGIGYPLAVDKRAIGAALITDAILIGNANNLRMIFG